MPHVGSDVVDLTDSDRKGKSRDSRFVDRVFTAAEKDLIRSSVEPDGMLWTLWAGKEAAYKVVSKSHPRVSSVPRSYEVELEHGGNLFPCSGIARTPAGTVPLQFFRNRKMVHAIGSDARQEAPVEPVWGVEVFGGPEKTGVTLADRPSVLVREALIRRLSNDLGCEPADLEVRRFGGPRGLGPPILYACGIPSAVDISLSHDGRFVAYAFIRPLHFTV